MTVAEFNSKIVPMRHRLLAQARRLASDDDLAEDLVQEVLLQLWQRRDTLDRHPNHEALGMTILRNKWYDHWRRQQYAEQRMTDSVMSRAAEETSGDKDDADIVRLIVAQLPPLQQQIFRMKELEGYEKQEIMQITGCSEESLRQNLSRARRRIREQFIKLTSR